MNTWPGGKRHAITQSEHEAWNSKNHPGTLQICCKCEAPTGRCEEDSIYTEDSEEGPFCVECWRQHPEYGA